MNLFKLIGLFFYFYYIFSRLFVSQHEEIPKLPEIIEPELSFEEIKASIINDLEIFETGLHDEIALDIRPQEIKDLTEKNCLSRFVILQHMDTVTFKGLYINTRQLIAAYKNTIIKLKTRIKDSANETNKMKLEMVKREVAKGLKKYLELYQSLQRELSLRD